MKIDKGIARPTRGNAQRKYPFPDMAIGDSIWVKRSSAEGARVAAILYGKQSGKRFSTRQDGNGSRIWRIA